MQAAHMSVQLVFLSLFPLSVAVTAALLLDCIFTR